VREETAPDDDVVRVVELEEEGFARRQRAELAAPAGLPEVDLVEVRPAAQEPVPVLVRDRHPRAHRLAQVQAVNEPVEVGPNAV